MELILTPQLRMAVTPTLLEEVAADPKEKYRGAVAAMIRDTLAMQHELAIDRPLSPLVSVARLRAQHADVSADFQNLKTLRQSYGDLPVPPVPGVKDRIIPLRSQAELMTEGRDQHNCVASYPIFQNRVLAMWRGRVSLTRERSLRHRAHGTITNASQPLRSRSHNRRRAGDILQPACRCPRGTRPADGHPGNR
jgi:hypothetical protein